MNKLTLAVMFTSSVLLAGCKDEAKTYAWYKEHPKETYTVYKKCLETGEASLNCDGARRAAITFMQLGDDETKALFESLER